MLQWLCVQLHFMDATITAAAEQSRFLQYTEMFRNGRKRHCVGPGEMGDTLIALGEVSENPAPGGVGERGESAIQGIWRIFNHLVKY